jgi:DNA-binding response OmpR family regulator
MPGQRGPGPPMRVLVVDGYADAADSTATLVRLWGHDARVARTTAEALRLARAFRPAVVLVELLLPDGNGYQLAAVLQAEAGARVLVALTGQGQDEDRRRSREAGYAFHLVKPAEPDLLGRLLEDVAARQPAPAH